MNSINLYDYIKYWMILKNLEENNPFDLIVYENYENTEIEVPKSMNFKTLNELGYEFWISGVLSALNKQYKNILLVIDNLNYFYLLPFLETVQNNNITIINLGSWISGFINKWMADLDDIWVLSTLNLSIYENYDLITFFQALQKKENKYIRVVNKEIPVNMFSWSWEEEWVFGWFTAWWDIVSLTEFGLSWSDWTMLIWASLTPDIIHTCQIMENEKKYDVFIISNYKFNITEELKHSIRKTAKLVVVLDWKPWYENYIKAQLFEWWITNISLYFLYPNAENITTNLKDYIYSQSNLDWAWIYKNIVNL